MAANVWLGVSAHAEPERLRDTLRFIRAHTDPDVPVALLPDGPDEDTTAALRSDPDLAALPQWGTDEAKGGAACLNRLARHSGAEILVLLESGALVGPRWLDLLLAALRRPGVGVAGPSTNVGWNEQAAFPLAEGSLVGVRRTAGQAVRRYGRQARELTPLHSLADFCYAIRREALDAVGPADEQYGLGPCWEMDLNVRAARAGYAGLWVRGAFVFRAAPTARRRAADADLLDASRRRYQDRFCGLRALAPTTAYRTHCEGDACSHFALPTPVTSQIASPAPPQPRARPEISRDALVSCVMPTRDRPEFALRAVSYFLRQDYPARELVIVEDGRPQLAALLPDDPRIRLLSSNATRSIGAMRNHGTSEARGEFVAQWDDDDWYGAQRLSRQLAPLLAGTADVTALRDCLFYELGSGRAWRLSPELHRRMFVRDVHGGTLVFRRRLWDRLGRYGDVSLAEDARFLEQVTRRGARLQALDADGVFVYIRHRDNSWRIEHGRGAGWRVVAAPDLPGEDAAFYARFHGAPTRPPLVSCLMPTYNRRRFVGHALEYFARQDYPRLELVVVDDGSDPVGDVFDGVPNVRYHRLDRRRVLGAKRNLTAELSAGEYLLHWDDDDWQAPGRVGAQVARLEASGAGLSGAGSLYFYAPERGAAWRYRWPRSRRPWAAGPTLCYRRDVWERARFAEVAVAEDTRFVWRVADSGIADVSELDCVVGLVHSANTVRKSGSGAYWRTEPAETVERLLGTDVARYRAPAGQGESSCLMRTAGS